MSQIKKAYLPVLFHGMLLVWLTIENPEFVHGSSSDKLLAPPGALKSEAEDSFPNDDSWTKIVKSPRFRPIPPRVFSSEDRKRIRSVQPHVRKAASKHGVSPHLINGIIWVESNFLVMSRGYRGSRGLMQLMPRTSRALAKELKLQHRPFDPSFNIEAGSLYFSQLVKSFDGNVRLALAAYKQGPASLKAILRRGESIPGFGRRYARRVLSAAQAFREREY